MKKMRLTKETRKAWGGRSRGFTLIEVVIAIALIGIIGAAILSALSTASLALIIADKRATAESLARTQMEDVKKQEYQCAPSDGVATYNITIVTSPDYATYSVWSENRTPDQYAQGVLIGVPWNSGNNTAASKDNGLQKIKLEIRRGGEAVTTLEDYKRGGCP
jgi:prepilin-type N-terminal cleavage/methylation domain-containing protein